MNLSKGEKLLAAKKRLKAFQLNKMIQDGSAKQKYVVTSSPIQCQNMESDKPSADIINSIMDTTENNICRTDQNVINNEVANKNLILTSENVVDDEQNNLKEPTISVQHIEEIISKPELKKNIDTNNFSKVQKDHLLEMATTVANIVTNDIEHPETFIDSDLIYQNQFLNSYVEEQNKNINDLHIQLSNAHSRISELEAKLEAKDTDFQTQLAREINPLQEQLQIHTQTTGILIAEKAELTAALNQAQLSVKQHTEEVGEMLGRLKSSQIHVVELEKEICTMKYNNEELKKNIHELQNKCEFLDKQLYDSKKEKEDLNLEVSELMQKLNLRKTELVTVQQELQEKTALLSLSELRIQQMKGATPTEEEKHAAMLLEHEIAQTKESLKAVMAEKDETNKQYQNYVKQLDVRQAKLLEEIKMQNMTIENLQQREQSYVQRLSELEQQLQQEKERVENLSSLQDGKDRIDNLLKNIDELTLEQERLHVTLSEKDSQIEMLIKDLNNLREASNQEAEVSKLASALESEQLGASRAVQQNRQLKEQLTDMENAFVSLSNAKLDLTEQLQAERSIGRKLNAQLNNVESEMEHLKGKLREKEALIEEFEQERLQTAQIADQMQHYQAKSHHVDTFQRELQHALITIEQLEKEKQILTEKLNERQENSLREANNIVGDNNLLSQETSDFLKALNGSDVTAAEPQKQLESRFKETMERVAELTEEKQKLEHLVLQLQSETETIGEYITLYQKQRAILQNRAREREQVFRGILEQRNQQQELLHKLKVLVSNFLREEQIHSNGTDHLIQSALQKKEGIANLQKENKVSELLDLLTEIKDCKDSCTFETNIQPCPWCSGKLLTV